MLLSPRPSDAGEPTSPQAKAAKKARTNEAEAAPAAAGAAAAGAAAAGAAAAGAAAAGAAAAGGAAGAAAGAGAAAAAAGGVVWARGTGYGYNAGARGTGGPVWDAKKAAAAQEAHDEQLRSVLTALAAALSAEFPSSSSSTEAAAGAAGSAEAEAGPSGAASEPQAGASAEADAAGPSSSSGRQQQQQQRRKAQAASESALTPSQERCLAAVRSSVLRPLLVQDLSQVAFTEMVTRHHYFTPLLSIVEALCHPAFEEFLAGNAAGEEGAAAAAAAGGSSSTAAAQQSRRACSVAGSLRGLQKGAAIVRKELSKALQQQQAAPGSSSGKVDRQAGGSGWSGPNDWTPMAAAGVPVIDRYGHHEHGLSVPAGATGAASSGQHI